MKCNALLTNAVIFHSALDIAEIVRHLLEEGWTIEWEDLAHISLAVPDRAHQLVRRVQHARAGYPAAGVRPEPGRGLRPVARDGPGRGRLRHGRLNGRGLLGTMMSMDDVRDVLTEDGINDLLEGDRDAGWDADDEYEWVR